MWTFNDIRIFVQDYSLGDKNIIARLQPVNAGTVYHHFGYEYAIVSITAYVVGHTDTAALALLARSDDSYSLVSPYGTIGNFHLNSINFKLQKTICQTLRQDLDEDSPVYIAELELYHDE